MQRSRGSESPNDSPCSLSFHWGASRLRHTHSNAINHQLPMQTPEGCWVVCVTEVKKRKSLELPC